MDLILFIYLFDFWICYLSLSFLFSIYFLSCKKTLKFFKSSWVHLIISIFHDSNMFFFLFFIFNFMLQFFIYFLSFCSYNSIKKWLFISRDVYIYFSFSLYICIYSFDGIYIIIFFFMFMNWNILRANPKMNVQNERKN